MSEPLAFASRFLARRGALVEERAGSLEAVLPPDLAREMDLPEAVTLAAEEGPGTRAVTYGSELLERMIGAATGECVAAAARLPGAAPREASAVAAARRFGLRNGVFAVTGACPHAGRLILIHAAFVLIGDERREGLSSALLSAGTGTPVSGESRIPFDALEPAPWRGLPRERAEPLMAAALAACASDAEIQAAPYREILERRLARDRDRIDGYFGDLGAELDRRKGRRGLAAEDVAGKRAAIARDRAAKMDALAARSALRIEIRPLAVVLIDAPAVLVTVVLKRRKGTRTLALEYDGWSRTLVPPACEHCRGPAPRPVACDAELHLLCETCAPKSEGRVSCPVCGTR